jgi:hypothetical protein
VEGLALAGFAFGGDGFAGLHGYLLRMDGC